MTPFATFLLVMTGFNLLEVALAIPLMRRRVKPNGLYGLRTSATFADETVWYDANAASARDMLVAVVVQLAALYLSLLFLSRDFNRYATTNLIVVTSATLIVAVVGTYRAHRMLKKRRAHGEAA